jgi:hypothetical protein
MLTAEQIVERSKPKDKTVHIPILDGEVRIRLFRKGEVEEMRAEAMVKGEVDNSKMERLLIQRGLIEPGLNDAAFDELLTGASDVYYAILNEIMELNGMNEMARRATRRTFRT